MGAPQSLPSTLRGEELQRTLRAFAKRRKRGRGSLRRRGHAQHHRSK